MALKFNIKLLREKLKSSLQNGLKNVFLITAAFVCSFLFLELLYLDKTNVIETAGAHNVIELPHEDFLREITPITASLPPPILKTIPSSVEDNSKSNIDIQFLQKEAIKDLVKKEISYDIQTQAADIFSNIDKMDVDAFENLYEEELPNDVIDNKVEDIAPPFNNKQIKDIAVKVTHKPPYFGSEPVIAIVIDDMGINVARTRDISALEAPITAAFLTYARHLPQQIAASQQTGQEIMIHVPMEPQKNVDVAPDVLTTKMSREDIQVKLLAMLDKFENVKGINNHMGSKLTEDYDRMKAVMEILKEKNLFFLDSKTSSKSQAERAAQDLQIKYAHRHVFLDNENNLEYIKKQLNLTERLARKNGYAIAIGHPKSQTFQALKEWLPTLPEHKIKLVHLSKIVDKLN